MSSSCNKSEAICQTKCHVLNYLGLILHVDIFRLTHIQDEEIVTSFVLLKLCTISSWPHFCHTHPLLPDDDHNVDQYQGLPGR